MSNEERILELEKENKDLKNKLQKAIDSLDRLTQQAFYEQRNTLQKLVKI